MTRGPAAPLGLVAAGYRAAGTVAASAAVGERVGRPRRGGGSRGTVGLRGIALDRLVALAEEEGAAGLCAVRFTTTAAEEPGRAETEVTATGLMLGLAGPAWAVEQPRVFATTLRPSDLVAMLRSGYQPRAVVPLELRGTRTSAGPSSGGVLVAPDLGARVLLGTLHWAMVSAARHHRGELVLTGDPEIEVRFAAGGPDAGTVEIVARLVADVFRYDAGHPVPAVPEPRSRVSLRRPATTFDAGPLADRVRR